MDLYRSCYDHNDVSQKIEWAKYVLLMVTPMYENILDHGLVFNEEDEQFIRVYQWMQRNLYDYRYWIQHYGLRACNERYLHWLIRYGATMFQNHRSMIPEHHRIWNQISRYFKMEEACLN